MSPNKNNGWDEWAHKRKDWNISNSKRPKLDIQKNHLSQLSLNNSKVVAQSAGAGRTGSFRRTISMPTKTDVSKMDCDQDDCDALEAKVLAEAAAAVELELERAASTQRQKQENIPSTSTKPPGKTTDYKNNGSSGFDVLFADEFADEDVEELMMLASQEIQASQKAVAPADSSLYTAFKSGIDVHSSILEPSNTFKKPMSKANVSSKPIELKPGTSKGAVPPRPRNLGKAKLPDVAQPTKPSNSTVSRGENSISVTPMSINPQAEAKLRELEKTVGENKRLTDVLRTKEGEATILRAQLKTALLETVQQKTVHARSVTALEQHYKDKLCELEKENKALELKLQFQEAETNTAKERYKLLTNSTQRLKLVEPHSPGPVVPSAQKTPSRQKHVSGFLNRSTFEEPQSQRMPPHKRPRMELEESQVEQVEPSTSEQMAILPKVETRSVGEQTVFEVQEAVDIIGAQRLVRLSLGQKLSERMMGIKFERTEVSDIEQWNKTESRSDEVETIPTLSLLKPHLSSEKRRKPLDGEVRPRLFNCAQSLQHLMSWNDPSADCPPTRASVLQVFEECAGVMHYNLLLLQDINCFSDRQLRNFDREIVLRGLEIVPLDKDFDLLDEKPWYKEECGVEMRRCLGVMAEIALVSNFAGPLITGTLESSSVKIKKHKFTELPEYSHLCKNSSDEEDDRFYLLHLLSEICLAISDRRLTIAFNGVLAGIMTLLRNCAQLGVADARSQSFFLRIVRLTLLARPASSVLLLLVELLASVSSCEAIMKGLCSKCEDDDCILDNSTGLFCFTKSACSLQVLCVQLRVVSEQNRWRLIDAVTKWLVAVISQGSTAPSWILSISEQDNSSHIPCCNRLTCSIVISLWDAFEMFEDVIGREALADVSLNTKDIEHCQNVMLMRPTLIQIMRRAVIILQGLIANQMFHYAARVEGLYELLLQGIVRLQKHLNLTPSLERYLEDLLKVERDMETTEEEVTSNDLKMDLYVNSAIEMLKLS